MHGDDASVVKSKPFKTWSGEDLATHTKSLHPQLHLVTPSANLIGH